jgi:hypothetical protein
LRTVLLPVPAKASTYQRCSKSGLRAVTYAFRYTAGAGWQGGATNQLIHNLQKKRGDGGYQYKAGAIAQSARAFSEAISASWLASAYLVPVPPSKIKTDAAYDDRMYRVSVRLAITSTRWLSC